MSEENKKTYEEKKREKEMSRAKASKAQTRAKTSQKIVTWAITLGILGGLGYGFFVLVQKQLPQGEDLSQAFSIVGRDHIDPGEQLPAPYNSDPPSSGGHYVQTAPVGYYSPDEEVSDQNLVHNLEHGDIWIAYHPRISEEVREVLGDFAASKVVVAPRPSNEFDVSLVAWGRVDSFNIPESGMVDEQRVNDFIVRYINKGPEKVNSPQFVGGHGR